MKSALAINNHNMAVADEFREAASLLAAQNASHFRVTAYLNAADTIEKMSEDLAEIARRGPAALEALPDIGKSVAAAVIERVNTGRWTQLERLRGATDPERLFQSIPGIGPSLAKVIHEQLHIETLEALEAAAHDGRLERVPGIGPRRVKGIRQALANMLARKRMTSAMAKRAHPEVSLLLDVDREYREKAAAGQLRFIAPKRFNPQGSAWLPILHTDRGNWSFTALFSNTARAHELGKTKDWVIIFYSYLHGLEDQCTVVTETSGPRKGQRVVRGREIEASIDFPQ